MRTTIKRRKTIKGEMLNRDNRYKVGLHKFVSFWRENIHRFIIDYFECIELKPFQNLLLYLMSKNVMFVYIASRGQGKSHLVAWFACAYAVLYPNVEIVITSGSKKQSKLMVTEKIEPFSQKYPNLGKEIDKINKNGDEIVVYFKNGSKITCCTPDDRSRGMRGNLLIIDEYRMVKKEMIDTVLKRFLASNRNVKFMSLPKWDGYPIDEFEQNRQIYMSSAWLKAHWSWDKFKDTVDIMLEVDNVRDEMKQYCAISLPYTVPLYHGILPLSQLEAEFEEKGFSQVKFSMEMEGQFYGQSEDCFFLHESIDNAMSLREIFIPDFPFEKGKGCKYDFTLSKLEDGEIRIISCDVGGTGNDNTVIVGIRCIPVEYGRSGNKRYYYRKEISFIKHIPLQHSEITALELKRLYRDFQASLVIMDTMGVSQVLYEACCKQTYDEKLDEYLDAWCTCNDDNLNKIKLDKDAKHIIYSVRAGATFNNEIAIKLRDELNAGKILLPIPDVDATSEFNDEIVGFNKLSIDKQVVLLQTFYESYSTMIELTNLDAIFKDNGLVSIEKPKGGKILRDRYTALAYGIWYAFEKEKENLNKSKKKRSSLSLSLYTPKR